MKKIVLLGLMISLFSLTACGSQKNEGNTNQEVKAVATFYPMYEFTKAVVGEEGSVELLIPAGTEAHDYEPSAKDIAKIAEANVFVYNHDDFETWVDQVTDNLDDDKTKIIEAADEIQLLDFVNTATDEDHDHATEDHDHEEEEEDYDDHDHVKDPHVWTDPLMAVKEVQEIQKELSEEFPEKKAAFAKNAEAYIAQLQALDQDFKGAFANATNKTFVVQHAAFGYLAHQYGLTQQSIAGVSPDQEPSPARLAQLKHFVEDNGIKVIYFEKNANSKVAETLSKETGLQLAVLNPVESLTKEQMAAGETYLSVMKENLAALKESIK